MQPLRLLLSEVHRAGRALLLLSVVLAGCPDDDDDSEPACPASCEEIHETPAEMELGSGDPETSVFVPLNEEHTLSLFPGPQGGYHVFLQLRTKGICPSRVQIERRLRLPGEEEVLRQQRELLPMVEGDDGYHHLPRAQLTFICPSNQSGVALQGRPLELEVLLQEELEACAALDGGARTLESTTTLVPTCFDGDTICRDDTITGCAAPP